MHHDRQATWWLVAEQPHGCVVGRTCTRPSSCCVSAARPCPKGQRRAEWVEGRQTAADGGRDRRAITSRLSTSSHAPTAASILDSTPSWPPKPAQSTKKETRVSRSVRSDPANIRFCWGEGRLLPNSGLRARSSIIEVLLTAQAVAK